MSRSWLLYLDDLIASAEKIWGVATQHVPHLLEAARALRDREDGQEE